MLRRFNVLSLSGRESWVERRTTTSKRLRATTNNWLRTSATHRTRSTHANRTTWAGFNSGSGFRMKARSFSMSRFNFSFLDFDMKGFFVEGESLGRE